ncbi:MULTISPECIES: hypothetical protein [Kitasatospora]|uniref:hypothetical protein n=1 Tax=Kitasatospora TaxID=2063 RepID=UPI000CAEAED8|nr:hypothetical protein [Kitasatospora sp. GP30]MDH6146034.1 hypothetical protein [Kitasatospora sp. GP30]
MPEDMPELMEQLSELAETGVPGSRVDTELAIRVGHGRRRRRRFAMTTAAAVLALGVGGLAALPAVGHGNQVAPAMSASEPVTDTAPATPVNPYFAAASMPADSTDPKQYVPALGSDPLVVEAGFGWLPSWAVNWGGRSDYQSSYWGGVFTSVTGRTFTTPGGIVKTPSMALRLYPAGATPAPAANGLPEELRPADPVNGREAFWMTSSTPSADVRLQWMTDTGRWAELDGYELPDTDPQATLHQVADSVRPSAAQIPLPVWLSDLPPAFKLSGSLLMQPNQGTKDPWSLQLVFTNGDGDITAMIRPIPPDGASPTPSADSTPTAPSGQACHAGNGVQICLTAHQADQMMAEVGTDANLLAHFHLLGSDPRTWTTWVQR